MSKRDREGPDRALAPTTDRLDEAALDALLRDMAHRFRWAQAADRYVLAGSWGSRTADFYRCRGEPAGAPDVVLKVGREWAPEEARSLHAAMEGLAAGLAEDGRTVVGAPTALGWAEAPPSVCMPYLEGTNVGRILVEGGAEHGGRSRWAPQDLLAECGRALGAYHAADAAPAAAIPPAAHAELRAAAATMWVSRKLLGRAGRAVLVAPRYFDIGPHQFLVTPAGDLFLLDPPVTPFMATLHRDLARFLHGLHRTLDRNRSPARRRPRESELREAFLGGYAETGPADPRRPDHRWLTSLYEGYDAAATTRRRIGTGHYGHAVRHVRDWLSRLIWVHVQRPPRR